MTEHKRKMTEDEAIYCLKAGSERYPQVCEECQLYGQTGCDHCYDDANDVAIKALEEIQQYRALGTVEEILKVLDNHMKVVVMQHETIKEYRNLGTVEELRVARDKQVAKKPKSVNNDYGTFDCPSCGHTIIALDDMTIHQNCLLCGQKLDWSDEDDNH